MCKRLTYTPRERRSERGAALVSALLLSLLLLTAGGALLLTTALTSTNSFDATAEMHAYYAAEAGMQQALNVLRSNDLPAGTIPGGSGKLSFRDVLGSPNLSAWITYDGPALGGVNTKLISTDAYSISVSDPDNTPPSRKPFRLRVNVTGYGPRMARKKLEALVMQSGLFGFQSPATITLIGADDPAIVPPVHFDTGTSNSVRYSGQDASGTQNIPAFATTSSAVSTVNAGIEKPNQVVGTQVGTLGDGTGGTVFTPDWLLSADATRDFVDILRQTAQPERYFTTATQPPASNVSGLTFMEGDATLGPGNQGSGLLVVTGNLLMDGQTSFNGLILVLGGGSVIRSGTGNGVITGGIVVARFGDTGGFLDPTFITNGGGNSTVQYDSNTITGATYNLPSLIVLGIAEK